MVSAGNKDKRLLPVNHTTKASYHHHHHHHRHHHHQVFLLSTLTFSDLPGRFK